MRLKHNQLVCLRAEGQFLLAELKDIQTNSQAVPTGWVRPLALKVGEAQVHDLRQAPDLLWPAEELEPAFDVEVLPMLAALSGEALFPEPERTVRLWQFVRALSDERARRAS